MSSLITGMSLELIIDDYNNKLNNIDNAITAYNEAYNALKTSITLGGAFGGGHEKIFREVMDYDHSNLKKHLLKSAWRYLYEGLQIERVAPETDIKRLQNFLEEPHLDFTKENVAEIFGEYVMDRKGAILRAFAEIFCKLDPYYKSHSKVKVGVKGLPKRVIISSCGRYDYYGYERIADILRVIGTYKGNPNKTLTSWQVKELVRDGESIDGITFKLFNNGNCHVVFDAESLQIINQALAEYYGNVLPDAAEEVNTKQQSTAVSKDLQFYRTPAKAVNRLLDGIYIRENDCILEPSCGDGAILDGIADIVRSNRTSGVRLYGVEVDTSRAAKARGKGYGVICDNFLTWQAPIRFDKVIMNPPFYGQHYFKHIVKAYSLLKEGGVLRAILPCTARYDHGLIEREFGRLARWTDLPVGSFSESGTNINTTILEIQKL